MTDALTPRRTLSGLQRLKVFERAKGVCHLCKQRIQVGEKWEVEHVRPLSMLGTNDDDNLEPAHVKCHAEKSRKEATDRAKVLRIRAKHLGAVKPSGFRKPPPGYDPWKRRMRPTP